MTQGDGGGGRFILRSVDDVGPGDQVVEVRRMEAEAVARDGGDVFGARPEIGGRTFFWPLVSLRKCSWSSGVRKALWWWSNHQLRARVGRVFEVDDGVDVAVEQFGLEQLFGFVGQTGVVELGARVELGVEKTAEEGGRSGPVKAMVVM